MVHIVFKRLYDSFVGCSSKAVFIMQWDRPKWNSTYNFLCRPPVPITEIC